MCRIRPSQHRRAPGTAVWRRGCRRAAGSRRAGTGAPCCSLLPPELRAWPGFVDRCQHSPEVPFPGSRQLRLLSALLSKACAGSGPGCQQMLVGRLQPRPWLPTVPHSMFTQQAACGTRVAVPPPPPATTHEERLPAVTNPAESGRRLRCSQSPREIVPRASPQPRGKGTRASLLGPPQTPRLGPAPQGLWQCLGGMESTPWTWPCADPLAKGCLAAPEGYTWGYGAPWRGDRCGTLGCSQGEGICDRQSPEWG